MMLPATTVSPPNFFTPKRRPALSRPLRDEPPAFLCAIVRLYSRISGFFISGGLLCRRFFGRGSLYGRSGLGLFGLLGRSRLRHAVGDLVVDRGRGSLGGRLIGLG